MARAIWNGRVIAESEKTETMEGDVYFPESSLKREYFRTSTTTSTNSAIGQARYLSLVIDGQGGFRGGYYQNTEVDKLLADANRTVDLKKRGDLYRQVQKIVVDDAPWIFVDNAIQTAASVKAVSGFKLHPSFYLFFNRVGVNP